MKLTWALYASGPEDCPLFTIRFSIILSASVTTPMRSALVSFSSFSRDYWEASQAFEMPKASRNVAGSEFRGSGGTGAAGARAVASGGAWSSARVSSFARPMDFRIAKSLLNSASRRKKPRGGASGFWRAARKPLPKTHLRRDAVERSTTVRWRRSSS